MTSILGSVTQAVLVFGLLCLMFFGYQSWRSHLGGKKVLDRAELGRLAVLIAASGFMIGLQLGVIFERPGPVAYLSYVQLALGTLLLLLSFRQLLATTAS